MNDNYHVHLSAQNRLLNLNLKEVWRYRDLIWLFTKRSFILTYKQTILGPMWIFLNPLISSIIYAIVFGGIAGISTAGVPQVLFYMCSNAVWIFFSTCVVKNANTFTDNANVFGKVYFPRLTTPISNVLSAIIQFGVQMILVIGLLIYFICKNQVNPNLKDLWLVPVILIHLGVLGLGIGIIISSFTTKYRDLAILVNFGVQLWMYATPVVYPLSQIKNGILKSLILFNPVTAPVELFRYAILGVGDIMLEHLIFSFVFTIIMSFSGIVIFNKVEKTFMDTV